jgi:hypothetical protein
MIVELSTAGGGAGMNFVVSLKAHFGLVEVSVRAQRRAGPPLTFGTMANIDDGGIACDSHAKSATLAFRYSLHAAFSFANATRSSIEGRRRLSVSYF